MSQAPRSSYGMRNKAPTAQEKRDRRESGINGLNYKKLQSSVGWSGQVHLSQTAEDAECLLSETQWPKKNGPMYYAVSSTHLDVYTRQLPLCARLPLRLKYGTQRFGAVIRLFLKHGVWFSRRQPLRDHVQVPGRAARVLWEVARPVHAPPQVLESCFVVRVHTVVLSP